MATKEKIFELIMEGTAEELFPLANEIKGNYTYKIVKKPSEGLIMFRTEETVEKIDFNVGEILVTTAEVNIENTLGYSMIMSMDFEKALDAAIIMGAYEANLKEKPRIEKLSKEILNRKNISLREEREIISSTRVNFEVMGGQDPNVQKYHKAQE